MNFTKIAVNISVVAAFLGMAGATTAGEPGTGPSFKGPIGLQLYSLRDQFKTDVPGTLDKVKNFGFKYAELAGTYGMTPEVFGQELKNRGIVPVAAHFGFDQYEKDIQGVIKEAKALKLKYAGVAWIPHQGDFDEKTCRAAAAVFNRAGAELKRHGIQFFYHIHGYEFQPYGQGTLFDLLMAETDPKSVAYEMDIFWAVYPGQDPVKLFQKYSKRWALVHLKDMRKGTETGLLTGKSDVRNDVAMGQGTMDMPAILKAARKARVKYYFIEDESPSVEQQIPQSLRYLETVRF